MDGRMDRQAESNMPSQLFQNCGHKKQQMSKKNENILEFERIKSVIQKLKTVLLYFMLNLLYMVSNCFVVLNVVVPNCCLCINFVFSFMPQILKVGWHIAFACPFDMPTDKNVQLCPPN